MAEPYVPQDFSAVDQTKEPDTFVHYLDTVTGLDAIHDYKLRTFQLLRPRSGHRVLDIGCGNGDDVRELAAMVGPTGHVVGIDKSEALVQEAAARSVGGALPVEFQVGDAHHLEIPSESFDGCRADRTFQHLDSPDTALREIARVTRSGGRVVVSDLDWEMLVIDASRPVTRMIANSLCDDCRQGWIGRQLPRLFKGAGLVDVVVEPKAMVITDFGIADMVFSLSATAERLRQAGIASDAEIEAWLGELHAARDAGTFFSAAAGFAVCGRKP